MEGIQTVQHIATKGNWFTKLDLKDAYLTVPVYSAFRSSLCFKTEGKFFKFVAMPFGLATAPRAFTKLLRPVVAHLRRVGTRVVIYLDDILLLHSSKERAREEGQKVKSLLESLGFVLSGEKSIEEPSQTIEYKGLIICSIPMSFSLTEKKSRDIQRLCDRALRSDRFSLRDISTILGNFNSGATPAVCYAQAH